MTARIHPTALVHPGACIADDAVIGPYCLVDDHTVIGSGTELRAFVHLCSYSTVGANCVLFENTVIGPEPQDKGFKGETSYVRVGDRTVLREHVTIHRASGEGKATVVGNDCLVMEGVHLGHNVCIDDQVIISSKSGLAGYVSVGRGSVIGGMAGFHQFIRVGAYAMVGGASKNSQDVPPFTLVDGHPCRVYGLNSVGLRRNGFSSEQRQLIKRVYRTIYHSGLLLREGVEAARQQFGSDRLAAEIVAFFEGGDHRRGVCRWPLAKGVAHED